MNTILKRFSKVIMELVYSYYLITVVDVKQCIYEYFESQ
jgi:hypothetical protein